MRFLILLTALYFVSFSTYSQVGFPYCETFADQGSVSSKTVFGGSATLVDGVLRLTDAQREQNGYVYIDIPFSPSYGIKASFEYFMYGGSGADGLTVFLFDADVQNFRPGGFGGALGYTQRDNMPGMTGGYLGIGFDAFGNYSNSNEGKIGGFSGSPNGRYPNSISIRKNGAGLSGYQFVDGKMTLDPPSGSLGLSLDVQYQFPLSSGGAGTTRVTDPAKPGYRKVFMELEPNPSGVGYILKMEMVVTTVTNEPRTITIFPGIPFPYVASKNLKIGFAASTGGETNIHEIRNLQVEVSNDEGLENPSGVDFFDFASCEGQENTYFITDEEVILPNENSEIRCLQFYASFSDIEEESDDICTQGKCREENRELILPQGTFRAGTNAGDFTFFPNEGFTDQNVTVYYTITDTYGKSSTGNAMTLKIIESPEPVRIFEEGNSDSIEEIRLCGGEAVRLISKGGEIYERYEWYKDDKLILGAESNELSVNAVGDYLVKAYNRKNCPAISNSILVSFPEFPDFDIISPVVACTPDQSVDVTESISNYDPVRYDYKLTGAGKIYLDDEMKEVSSSGAYEIQIKHADLDCYSSPEPLQIVIPEEKLLADFDFEIQGTGVKGEDDGGFFPDDVFQFRDLSPNGAQSWSWDFGDGSSSTDKNPTQSYGKKGDFDVALTFTNMWGCEATLVKRVSIIRSYRVMFPTGFTPLDNENQFFVPKSKGLVSAQLLIFNTWGNLIFESDDINSAGWDGKLEGKLLDAGFYVYRYNGVATDGEKVTKAGKFKLIR
ncbi:gliding motility-associated-like protein [Algoriphagus ratkowskyi]|uniref:Gliding motility-associated-like protein n=1 Tax=Algoriphagus ratkowskyi TaxID=57028 RepID=A0A2W7RJQ9_9BACT|nr:PKD domain-containing protein [Algoriphagus ratkowskyi]PZX60491.1 gliding motility-associated-like protein [Algoriphagus ratkowskyi]TXD78294.1 PKD domain-containing protein [Algoriphagus ratkowskyi]